MDYIGVRKVAPDGSIVGEARLIGLFTSKAYMEPAAKTPLLHHKLEQLIAAEDLIPGSHDYKAVVSRSSSPSRRTSSSRPPPRSSAASWLGSCSSRSTAGSGS